MLSLNRFILSRIAAAIAPIALLMLAAGTAYAVPKCTKSGISLSPNPVTDGTDATVTGSAKETLVGSGCPGTGATENLAVTVGTITLQENTVSGTGVQCGNGICQGGAFAGAVCSNSSQCDPGGGGHCEHATFSDIPPYGGSASGTPDGSGEFSNLFDTSGLGGMVIGFRAVCFQGVHESLRRSDHRPCLMQRWHYRGDPCLGQRSTPSERRGVLGLPDYGPRMRAPEQRHRARRIERLDRQDLQRNRRHPAIRRVVHVYHERHSECLDG